MKNYLRIGKIISLHGLKGEIKVFPTTDDVRRFDKLDKFYITSLEDADDKAFIDAIEYEAVGTKYIKNTCILKIKDCDNVDTATKLIGKSIYVSRENAVVLSENEFYVVDLIDSLVYLDDKCIGNVDDVMKTKANSILVVKCDNREILIPLVSDFVEKIDTVNSKIHVKNLEGLM